jgi:hypothetical protein
LKKYQVPETNAIVGKFSGSSVFSRFAEIKNIKKSSLRARQSNSQCSRSPTIDAGIDQDGGI